MNDKERLKELKKENDQKLGTLSDTYHFIANSYVLKARGYADYTLDREARIKDVLDEIVEFYEKGMPAPIAIPNTTEYIESKIKMLAKKSNKSEKIKSIIFTSLFLLMIVLVVGFGLYLRRANYLDTPSNISHTVISNNELSISWDRVESASLGYTIYYKTNKDSSNKLGEIKVEQPDQTKTRVECIINIDTTKEYIIYIYANDVTTGSNEDMVVIYYGSDHAEYKYTPSK